VIFAAPRLCVIALFVAVAQLSAQPTEAEQGARLFQTNCVVCHGHEGDAVESVDFAKGRFKRAANDEDLARLITRGVPGTSMPPFDMTPQQISSLIAYFGFLRASVAANAVGNAARGEALFAGKGGCTACHRIDQNGSRVGPDLSEIGGVRTAAALEQSILDPDAVVSQDHLYIRAVTTDGVTITGRRLNEDPNSVQLLDTNERLVGLNKADLREYTLLKTSAMPSYRGKLSAAEVSDIVKYLSTRRGSSTR
jgi:cytochrome c oxidase cbb3-type subunit III